LNTLVDRTRRQHALVAQRGQLALGRRHPDQRLVIELPVAGVEHAAMRRVDHQRIALGDRVRQRHIAHVERPDAQRRLVGHHVQRHVLRDPASFSFS